MTQSWTIRDIDPTVSQALADACGLSPLVARTLVARDISSAENAEAFLHPSLDRDWSDPALIPGMTAVADALEEAIRAGRRILVFGDFDVDGISATACMLRGLAALGAQADYLIPNRVDEGYGLTAGALERIYERAPELLITVDCGISAGNEVAELLERGIQVLVTDHHEPSGLVPRDIPVADPKMVEDSPQAILAGVGVALKLITLLGERFGKPRLWRDLVDLATLGTLADVMPLTGENRSLVAEGLSLLRRAPRPGIASVLALARRGGPNVSSIDLSFSLIPRLNAAGRMGDPSTALELLINDDPQHSFEIANILETANNERRSVEGTLFTEALRQVETDNHGQKILIIAGEGWHEGIRGIVASRLVSRFGLPVIVFTLMDDEARGSGRSIGDVNLFGAVERCADLTLRFGGHAAAVGVTIPRDHLGEFKARMEAIMEEEAPGNFHPPLLVDAQLEFSELDVEAVEQLALLEPYGQGNREPLYVSCGVSLRNTRAVGAKKNHLSFTATDGRRSIQGIWFQCPSIEDFIAHDGPVDIIYRPQVDEWNGVRRAKLMVTKIYGAVDNDAHEEEDDGGGGGDVVDQFSGSDNLDDFAEVIGLDISATADASEAVADAVASAATRAVWEQKAREASPTLVPELATAIIGAPVRLHPAQSEALDALGTGESALAVMATGRGKSLIFQTHAARLALSTGTASLFVYPLRALIADQAVHIAEGFARLGLEACSLTGENTTEEKDRIFQRLYEGNVDVLLTTPEFFNLHAWRFAESTRVGFIVFDEAHHIQTERNAGREGYHGLAELRKRFPPVQYLAVTATSDDRITSGIRDALGIERVIVDATRRDNLTLNDARAVRDRESYLGSLIDRGEKAVIYVNSRAQAIVVARLLRKRGADRGRSIAFYHAGLTRVQRRSIEEGFRNNDLRVIISTSAFGEGVNIPDISHVVLYHLPLSAVAFNQTSGRAGRNGQAAVVHLLYNEADVAFNRRLLASSAPQRGELETLYRVVRSRCGAATASISDQELTEACHAHDSSRELDEKAVGTGLAIFEELGLLERDMSCSPPRITLIAGKRVELSASSRYLEGEEERALFERFRQWALQASADDLREQIIGPLVPSDSGYDSGYVSKHER